jgi:hypothetical protein
MKVVIGLVLGMILVSSIFANAAFAETIPKYKTKTTTKKDMREISTPETGKTIKITKITKSRTLAVLYIVSIEVCAGREKIYNPDLEIKSDRDSISVTLWGMIMSNTCKPNDYFIRANDPATISASFAKTGYQYYPRMS